MAISFTICDELEKTAAPASASQPVVPPIYTQGLNQQQMHQYMILQNKLAQADFTSVIFSAEMNALKEGYGGDKIIIMRLVEDLISIMQSPNHTDADNLKKLQQLANLVPAKLAEKPLAELNIEMLNPDQDPYKHGYAASEKGKLSYRQLKQIAQKFSLHDLLAQAHK